MNEQEYKIHFGYGKSDDENLWCSFSTSQTETKPNQTKPNKMKSTVLHCHSIAYRGPSRSPSLVLLHTFSLLHFNCFAFSTVIIIKFISKMINRNSTNSEHSLTRTNQIAIFYLHIHIRHVDPTDISYRCVHGLNSVLFYINHRKMTKKI